MEQQHIAEKNVEHLPVIYLTKSMQDLYQKGRRLACDESGALLISGQNGTGKELLAKSIHYYVSPDAPFVTINCTCIPFKNLHFVPMSLSP